MHVCVWFSWNTRFILNSNFSYRKNFLFAFLTCLPKSGHLFTPTFPWILCKSPGLPWTLSICSAQNSCYMSETEGGFLALVFAVSSGWWCAHEAQCWAFERAGGGWLGQMAINTRSQEYEASHRSVKASLSRVWIPKVHFVYFSYHALPSHPCLFECDFFSPRFSLYSVHLGETPERSWASCFLLSSL